MNQTADKSGLDISIYTNYIVNNCIREHIELKNEVKTKGVIFDKNRYAILTSYRFLVFANREAYLNKKKPRKEFKLIEHDFIVDSDSIQILKEGNVLKEYIFPTIEIAVHWWESILQLKRSPRVEEEGTSFIGFNQEASRIGNSIQPQDGRGTSNIFTRSIIEDLNGVGIADGCFDNGGGGFGSLVKEENEKSKKRKLSKQPVKKALFSCIPEDKKSETSAKFPTEGNENKKQIPKDNTNNNDDKEEEEGELNKSRIEKGKNDDDNDLHNKEPYTDIIGKDRNSNNNNKPNKNTINFNINNEKQSNKSNII